MKFLNKWIDSLFPKFESMFNEEDGVKSTSSLNKILFKILTYAILFAASLLVVNLLLMTFTDRGGVFGDFMGGILNPILTFFYPLWPYNHYRNSASRTAIGTS